MGSSQADGGKLKIHLDRIRFGHRVERPERMKLSFMEEPIAEVPRNPKRPALEPKKSDPDPGYDAKYQRRLW